MDLRRVRRWEWLTGAAGVVLLVSLFLPWYGLDPYGHATVVIHGSSTASAWQAFSVVDVVLAVVALGAIALPVVAAMQRTAAVPQAFTALLMPFAIAAAVVAVVRLLNAPDITGLGIGAEGAYYGPIGEPVDGGIDVTREIGAWLGAAAAIAILLFDYRSMADSRTPHAMRSRLDVATIPAPTADGERRDLAT
jgi:hypothetical protein